jgi:uncharacterized damage-inducible protein DinB
MQAKMTEEQLLETWLIHNRVNLYMLDGIQAAALTGTSVSGGRSVGAIFAHIHNIRLAWIEPATPHLMKSLTKIPTRSKTDLAAISKDLLHEYLVYSGTAVELLLRESLPKDRVKGTKLHPPAFMGYLISHESHHRGEIELILSQCGYPLEDEISYGMWEWEKR